MAYEKQNWTTKIPITPEKLNHMEDGIANSVDLDSEQIIDGNKTFEQPVALNGAPTEDNHAVRLEDLNNIIQFASMKRTSNIYPDDNTANTKATFNNNYIKGGMLKIEDNKIIVNSDKIKGLVISCGMVLQLSHQMNTSLVVRAYKNNQSMIEGIGYQNTQYNSVTANVSNYYTDVKKDDYIEMYYRINGSGGDSSQAYINVIAIVD